MRRSVAQLMDLTGRTAVVTGGAGFIGSAMGEALAELGARVVVMDMRAEACEKVAAELNEKFDRGAVGLTADLGDERSVHAALEQLNGRFDCIDILVNNAAFVGTSGLGGWVVPFAEQSVETWRKAMEVNLTAPFALAQALAPALARSAGGSIINVSSIYGLVGPDWRLYEGTAMGNPAAYAASKGGLLQLTRWLATTMAPKVRVNGLVPGGVERGQAKEFQSRYIERTPMGRMATEEDFKGAIAYLASDLSAYVTGQVLQVDGGWTIW
ncbi:MAG TPA: SDR family oxidoreductase [Magnetospirillum sp.]|nr:SDR family oxidoreductase [Magnetospirillum sp.]